MSGCSFPTSKNRHKYTLHPHTPEFHDINTPTRSPVAKKTVNHAPMHVTHPQNSWIAACTRATHTHTKKQTQTVPYTVECTAHGSHYTHTHQKQTQTVPCLWIYRKNNALSALSPVMHTYTDRHTLTHTLPWTFTTRFHTPCEHIRHALTHPLSHARTTIKTQHTRQILRRPTR